MRKIITILLMAVFPLCLSAEKKVSKITIDRTDANQYVDNYETHLFSYDESGRLINFMQIADGLTVRDVSFEYINDNKILAAGLIDNDGIDVYDNIEISLDNNGSIKSALFQKSNIEISVTYRENLMSEIIWNDLSYSDQMKVYFGIENGNPTKLMGDDWDSFYPTFTYSDIPNKCGLLYLPVITENIPWGSLILSCTGLLGYGSRTLPYSCQFYKNGSTNIINYVFDNDGYLSSMVINNDNFGDGKYKFEYCDVNGVDDVVRADVHVLGGQGCITIEGEYVSAKVYDLGGMRYPGTENLVPGIYIVDVDGMKFKAAVN